ncbi:MAG: DUF1285 domain-containing protein [Oligoflexia bacterium]|nr:DUF1285 domain-containing protein [Oligoflexia bacterium]
MTFPIYTALLKGSLKLDRNGKWWHDGKEFQNTKLAKLFHRSIEWQADRNEYLIKIGREQATFDVEDCAYFVVSIDDREIPWRLTFIDDSTQALDPHSLELGTDNQVYTKTTAGHRAKLLRSAHQVLLRHVIDDEHLEACGVRIRLASAAINEQANLKN